MNAVRRVLSGPLASPFAGSLRAPLAGNGAPLVPHTRLTGPMPWVVAILVALTVIALAAGLALGAAARTARAELEGGLTVQILEPRQPLRDGQARAAAAALAAVPGVVSVRVVPQAEIDALIAPWLGTEIDAAEESAVPIPALIDVQLRAGVDEAALATVRRVIAPAAPSARVDAQSTWLGPAFAAIGSLVWLAFALIALLFAALAAVVVLAVRHALGSHRDTIEIVHLLGGSDAQIARVFQRATGIDAAAGGAMGFALGTALIVLLSRSFARLGSGLGDAGALAWSDWLALALVPVATTLLTMGTARLTVMHALRKML